MGAQDDAERLELTAAEQWHAWLAEHHEGAPGAWLVVRRGAAEDPGVPYDEAVREALCWGWVDGLTRRDADGRSVMWFTRRRAGSAWARSNRDRVADLEAAGRMQPAGRRAVEAAKANGRWSVLVGPEALVEPPELARALDAVPAARQAWDAFPPSVRKQALTTIALAARAATAARHVERIVGHAARGERPV